MSDNVELPEFNGFKLACNPIPYGMTVSATPLSQVMRVWSRQEILDYLKTKPKKMRRKQFSGSEWVINQGSVGSCSSAATVGAFRRAIALNGFEPVPKLNWEFLYAQNNWGRDGGSLLVDANNTIREVGVCPMRPDHRFNKDIFKNNFRPEDYNEASKWKAEKTIEVNTEEELATLVLSGTGVANVAVHVGNNFMSYDKYGCPGASSGGGNHAVGVQDVELVDGRLLFESFNSWGLDFGPDRDGHNYYEWNRHFVNTVNNHKFFGIVSVDIKADDQNMPVVS